MQNPSKGLTDPILLRSAITHERSPESPATRAGFPIVGVGASAGGLEAFERLLGHVPADTALAFVFVQHRPPGHECRLEAVLSRATPMVVCSVRHDLRVEANHVYVIPPDKKTDLCHGVFKLTPRPSKRGPSIDDFLCSLAEDHREYAIGVLLSGCNADGTLGLRAIKAKGGRTFAQNKHSARYHYMPCSAVKAGCVDAVLPPEGIAQALVRICHEFHLQHHRPAKVATDIRENHVYLELTPLLLQQAIREAWEAKARAEALRKAIEKLLQEMRLQREILRDLKSRSPEPRG